MSSSLETLFSPDGPLATAIPRRFAEIATWKGPVDAAYMEALRLGYARAVLELGGGEAKK